MQSRWIPYELHTHTHHSDGQFTIATLAQTAKSCGLEGIAITDHNTFVPIEEIREAREMTGVHILSGMEWTTFYGHMTILGIQDYVDWRKLSQYDIQKGIDEVHKQGGIVGIAHPYRVGSPLCTGCYWQYEVKDWEGIDYYEVWSELKPPQVQYNSYSYNQWIDLLNKGYQVTGAYGLDWHRPYGQEDIPAVSYLALEGKLSDAKVIEAIKRGRIMVTMGPVMDLDIRDGQHETIWHMGETIERQQKCVEAVISLDHATRKDKWHIEGEHIRIVLRTNQGNLLDEEVSKDCCQMIKSIDTEEITWVIGELYGKMKGKDTQIAFTNPIYFR